jgi:hypothetical protein
MLLAFLVNTEGAGATDRRPASSPRAQPQALNLQLSKAQPLASMRIARTSSIAGTLRRLTKRVNALTSAYNALVTQHNELVSAVSIIGSCLGRQPVTRYAGYWWGIPEIQTSALDFTEPGDPVSVSMTTWNC